MAHTAAGLLVVRADAGGAAAPPGASYAARVSFRYPLRLFVPRPHDGGKAAALWCYAATYGGGLVSGDEVSLAIDVEEGASVAVGSLAEGKVYRRRGGEGDGGGALPSAPARMDVTCEVRSAGLLVWAPEPTSLYRDSALASRLAVRLEDDSAACVLVDCVTAGRTERGGGQLGEQWSAASVDTRVDISVGDKLVLSDYVRAAQPHLRRRLGGTGARAACLLVVLGSSLAGVADAVEAEALRLASAGFHASAVSAPPPPVFASASRFHGARGVVVRAASTDVASMRAFVRRALAPLCARVGDQGVLHAL